MSKPNSHQVAIDAYEKVAGIVDMLAGRWECEKEYEDFKDYEAAFKRLLPDTVKFVKATKRPFGVIFTAPAVSHQGNTSWFCYRVFIKRNKIPMEIVK